MKKLVEITVFAVLSIFLAGCHKDVSIPYYHDVYYSDGVLDFVNDSYSSVTFFVPAKGAGLPAELDDWHKASFYEVGSHSSMPLNCMYDNFKSPVETYAKGDVVPFYVFDSKTLSENEWADIVAGKKWLAVYEYNATQLIEMGKKVTYPAAD